MRTMRIHLVATYFREFRDTYYKNNSPSISAAKGLVQERRDWIYCISKYAARQGHEIQISITNDRIGQLYWALNTPEVFTEAEYDLVVETHAPSAIRVFWTEEEARLRELIAFKQIAFYEPQVVIFFNAYSPDFAFRQKVRELGIPVVTLCSYAIPSPHILSNSDLVMTVLTSYEKKFMKAGYKVAKYQYGFDVEIQSEVDLKHSRQESIVFIGQLNDRHTFRRKIFEEIARNLPFNWFGPKMDVEKVSRPLQESYRGEVFGMRMYHELSKYRVGINGNADFALMDFGNLRTFEQAGLGLAQVIALPEDLPANFIDNHNVLLYTDAESAVKACVRLFNDSCLCNNIGVRGRETVEQHYSADEMVRKFLEIIQNEVRN